MSAAKSLVDTPVFEGDFVSTDDKTNFSQLRGKYVVVYFYPKDSTPGCTRESCDFRDHYQKFVDANCEILGISRDGMKSHNNFREKQSLPFALISDPNENVCKAFKVMNAKGSVERSTFLISPEGKIVQEWRKVSVPGHAGAVLEALHAHRGDAPATKESAPESADDEKPAKRAKTSPKKDEKKKEDEKKE